MSCFPTRPRPIVCFVGLRGGGGGGEWGGCEEIKTIAYCILLCRKLAAMIITVLFFLQVKELQYRVLDQELNKWKREQQLSGNGKTFSNNLDTIQKW